MDPSLPADIFLLNEAEGAPCNQLHKRLITKLSEKIALALRVEAKISPLCVTRCLFGMTKLRASRLDWSNFSFNRGGFIAVNRPNYLVVVLVTPGGKHQVQNRYGALVLY